MDRENPTFNTTSALCVYEFPSVFGYSKWPLEFRLVCAAWRDLFDDFAPRNLYRDKVVIYGERHLQRRITDLARIKRWFGLHVRRVLPSTLSDLCTLVDAGNLSQV